MGQLDPKNLTNANNAAVDNAVAQLDNLTNAYNAYIAQVAVTNSAAGQYMKDDSWSWLWFHMDDVNKVMMAIDSLPRDLAGLSPSGTLLSKYSMALANMAAGAEWMVANNTLAVQEAQDAHAACEKTLQIGGAVSMATAGAEILTEEGCEAFAAAAAKQIANLAAAQLVNTAVGQSVNYLATKFNINPAYLQIGADSVQLFFLVKAAQQERIKNNSGCFVAGTEVLTGSSSVPGGTFSEEPIQDIQVGDEVLTRDQNDPNAPLQEEQVTQVIQHTVYALSDVTILDADGQTEVIRATPEHPFYVDGLGWTGASQLTAGEQLEQPDGSLARVVSVTGESDPQGVAVYNFTVAADHTYFVDQGGDAVWVHNVCSAIKQEYSSLPNGKSPGIKVVQSEAELTALFDKWSAGGTLSTPATYPGRMFRLPDGTMVGLRGNSLSGGSAIDVFPPLGKCLKVHVQL